MAFSPAPTNITCPFCRANITVPLRQIVDVSEEPVLKDALLAGRLNAFRCPSCGNVGALASPFFYHDPDKELAFIFLPMDVGLKNADQQRLIGSLTNAVMSKLPPEKRKAYLLQPKQFFALQNLVDAILEADGITPDMIAAQQARMDLLQTLADTPAEQLPAFIKEHDAEMDAEFFDLLNTLMATAQAGQAANDFAQLTGVRNQLLEHSTLGQKIKAQQQILQVFVANPSRETLVEQVIQAPDPETREMLVAFGRSLLDYPFFQALTSRIEAASTSGDQATAKRLVELRKEIQEIREKLDAATRAVFEARAALVREMMESEDMDKLARQHMAELDDAFFGALEAQMAAAQQAKQQVALERLQAVGAAAMRAAQSTQPPEVRFINALLSVDYPAETARLLEANKRVLSPQLLNWMRRVANDLRGRGQQDAAAHLEQVIQQAADMIGPAVVTATS